MRVPGVLTTRLIDGFYEEILIAVVAVSRTPDGLNHVFAPLDFARIDSEDRMETILSTW